MRSSYLPQAPNVETRSRGAFAGKEPRLRVGVLKIGVSRGWYGACVRRYRNLWSSLVNGWADAGGAGPSTLWVFVLLHLWQIITTHLANLEHAAERVRLPAALTGSVSPPSLPIDHRRAPGPSVRGYVARSVEVDWIVCNYDQGEMIAKPWHREPELVAR